MRLCLVALGSNMELAQVLPGADLNAMSSSTILSDAVGVGECFVATSPAEEIIECRGRRLDLVEFRSEDEWYVTHIRIM